MLVEWVLEQNGKKSVPYQFSRKVTPIKGALFPPDVQKRTWLRERLVALYEHVEPLRSTVIHARTFTSTGGALVITAKKGQSAGTPVTVSSADLRRRGNSNCNEPRRRLPFAHRSDLSGRRERFRLPGSLEELQGREFILRRSDRARFAAIVPDDVDPAAVAAALPE